MKYVGQNRIDGRNHEGKYRRNWENLGKSAGESSGGLSGTFNGEKSQANTWAKRQAKI